MYRCEVDMLYRQHDKNYDITKVRKEFIGKDKDDVYGYIKYYCLKFGMCDVQIIDEHEVGKESIPVPEQDHTDTGAPTFAESVEQTQNAIQQDIDIT